MKYHRIHAIFPKDGRNREALIEFSIAELRGLSDLLVSVLIDPELDKAGTVFVSFENREAFDAPAINCWYDKKRVDDGN